MSAPGLRGTGLAGLSPEREREVLDLVRPVQDYPSPGVTFRDITPLLADPVAFRDVITALAERVGDEIDLVAGMEARGFLVGSPLASHLGVGFVPVRKAGKLPPPTQAITYDLEYGTATIELRAGTLTPGARVLLVDDVLATGGTAAAGAQLVERCGGEVVALAFLLEIDGLGGRERLGGRSVDALLRTGS
ncbi:adenine phosphoribosyltransferase [Oerskovia flava]|uniref:adenine phosphoribosyltransferase n=1 Tax=Oerskovia flava TaxID=2986422 RepID=UPI00223EF6F0|nr:adenine phosphoribosyltransferase [Oerskovia sp. JB1-3-2]